MGRLDRRSYTSESESFGSSSNSASTSDGTPIIESAVLPAMTTVTGGISTTATEMTELASTTMPITTEAAKVVKAAAANVKLPPPLPTKPFLTSIVSTISINMSRAQSSTTTAAVDRPGAALATDSPLDVVQDLSLGSGGLSNLLTLPDLTLPLTLASITFGEWVTIIPTTTEKPVAVTAAQPGQTGVSYCQSSDRSNRPTQYSVVYTSTVTWTGLPDEYTAPFPPLVTPKPSCVESPAAAPVQYTLSRCNGTDAQAEYRTCEFSTTTVYDVMTDRPKSENGAGKMGQTTVIVTEKNPAVVYASSSLPDYGGGTVYQDKSPATAINRGSAPSSVPAVPIVVSLRPGAVTINDEVYTDSPALKTQVAYVGGEYFTIEPSRVVGAGTTLSRPEAGIGPLATTTSVGGAPVVVGSAIAVIDGSTFSLDGPATTKVVQETTLAIGSGGVEIIGATQTARIVRPPSQTDVVVAGGEVVTAIGTSVVVIRGTTITYGPSIPATKVTVNGDEVTIGSSGVTLRNTVLGGATAKDSQTQYEVVGGATITQVAPSVVIIRGSTYTVGPGSPQTTLVVGEQTLTLGPSGVAMSTMTLPFPFGQTATAVTIIPGATATGGASATGSSRNGQDDANKESAAAGLRPSGLLQTLSMFYVASGFLVWTL